MSLTTAIRIKKPCTACCQKGEMRIRVREFWMMPTSRAPQQHPRHGSYPAAGAHPAHDRGCHSLQLEALAGVGLRRLEA
jgi:hypothetical protein